jgi:adenylate kinase family enzyme
LAHPRPLSGWHTDVYTRGRIGALGMASHEPEPDEEVEEMGSEGEVDEVDLTAYEQDPWDSREDFHYQQQRKLGACQSKGFLLVGKPGAGKTHLAGKLAQELGVVHVGLPQILSASVVAYTMKLEYDELQTKIDAEKAKANKPEPAVPAAPVEGAEEGAYNDEGEAPAAGAPAPAGEEGEEAAGPDEELIAGWVAEQQNVTTRWLTLELKPAQFAAVPDFLEAAQLMMAGKAVDGDLLGRLLVARLRAPDVQFRGYVIESLPPPLLPDILLQADLPKLEYVLDLVLTDAEAKARLDRCTSLCLCMI